MIAINGHETNKTYNFEYEKPELLKDSAGIYIIGHIINGVISNQLEPLIGRSASMSLDYIKILQNIQYYSDISDGDNIKLLVHYCKYYDINVIFSDLRILFKEF